MQIRTGLFASLALALVMAGTGCSNKTAAERESLLNQNEDLKKQLDAERAARQAEAARANAATANATVPTETVATPDMGPTLDLGPTVTPGRTTRSTPPTDMGNGVTHSTNSIGEDVIAIQGDVLFDSGKAALKPTAKKLLDKVAADLKKSYPGKTLRVEGHTDPAPVRTSGWDDNWDLGAARARAVLLYLGEKGISAKNMYIASFAANDLKSTKNMALNRRVEIVVVRNAK